MFYPRILAATIFQEQKDSSQNTRGYKNQPKLLWESNNLGRYEDGQQGIK